MYSPSGKPFVFMHRWIGPHGKFSRLCTANTDGSDIYCLADDRMVSHKKSLLDIRQFYWWEENGKFAEGEFEDFPNNSSLLKSGYEFS